MRQADTRLTLPVAGVTLPGMFGIGATELLIILGICVLLFGARRLPEIGSGLGKAIKNFKSGVSGKDEIDVTPRKDELREGSGGTAGSETGAGERSR